MNTSEAMTLIRRKLGDRVSIEAAEELERDFSAIERDYGPDEAGKIIKSHCGMIFTVFGVGA